MRKDKDKVLKDLMSQLKIFRTSPDGESVRKALAEVQRLGRELIGTGADVAGQEHCPCGAQGEHPVDRCWTFFF